VGPAILEQRWLPWLGRSASRLRGVILLKGVIHR
jgi:hypothetical protein